MPEAPGVAVPADGGGHPGVPGEGLPVHHEDVAVLQPHPRHRPDNIQYSTVTCLDVKLGRLTAKIINERWLAEIPKATRWQLY